jgi:hypothetical protein
LNFAEHDALALPTVTVLAPPVGDTFASIANRQVNVDAALSRLTLPLIYRASGLYDSVRRHT